MSRNRSTRRDFLKTSSLAAGAVATTPYFWTSGDARAASANDRLGVGCIGVGSQGSGIGGLACRQGNKIACADVDRKRAEGFAGNAKGGAYTDYRRLLDRKDIDVVTIATPDHWHAKIAIDAMKAGKDVYCEKPLTLTIDEGKQVCKVAQETKRVVQVGTQQRSDKRFLTAIAIVRSGRLGKTLKVTCSLSAGPRGGPFATAEPPAELDWDMWLGQCPKVPYTKERCHHSFRWWLEYSGGKLTDWGAHHIDIAQWAIGCEATGPIEIEGKGDFPTIPDNFNPVDFFAGKLQLPNAYNTATQFCIDLRFANGSTIRVQHGPGSGVSFEGEGGKIFVDRGKITGKSIEDLTDGDEEWLRGELKKLYKGKEPMGDKEAMGHMQNFFACAKDRSLPVSDVFSHHRAISSCHLCNGAMLLKRKLTWDPVKEDFVGDQQASALVKRPQRTPYAIEA